MSGDQTPVDTSLFAQEQKADGPLLIDYGVDEIQFSRRKGYPPRTEPYVIKRHEVRTAWQALDWARHLLDSVDWARGYGKEIVAGLHYLLRRNIEEAERERRAETDTRR